QQCQAALVHHPCAIVDADHRPAQREPCGAVAHGPHLLTAPTHMRDFELPGRSEAFAANAMAATSHPSATLAALEVLRRGGNAIAAATAAVALLGVVEPTQTGIGGDCFVLLMRRGEGEVIALNGSGWAPAAASIDHYAARGMTAIPVESPHAVTVPGAVA